MHPIAHTNSLFHATTHPSSKAGETREAGRQTDRRDESRRRFALTSGIGAYLARLRHVRSTFPKYNIMYSFVRLRAPLLYRLAGRPGPTRRLVREDRPVLYFRCYSFVAPCFIPRLLVSWTKRAFYRGALSLRTPPVAKSRSLRAAGPSTRQLHDTTLYHCILAGLTNVPWP